MYHPLIPSKSMLALFITASLSLFSPSRADSLDDIGKTYFEVTGKQPTLRELSSEWLTGFSHTDQDADGVDAADIEFVEKMERAEFQASAIRQVLVYDLNQDLIVSLGELSQYFNSPNNRHLRTRIYDIMKADRNGDDKLEGAELYAASNDRDIDAYKAHSRLRIFQAMLAADPDRDGKLTFAEGEQLIGQLTQRSQAVYSKPATKKPDDREAEKCPSLQIPEGSQFVVFGAHHSTAMSTISVDETNRGTDVATVFIENGDQPITLLLASTKTMVWQFRGNIDRLSKVIISGTKHFAPGSKVRAGAVGIPEQKVQFIDGWKCFGNFNSHNSTEGATVKTKISNAANRAPDVFLGDYEIDIISLPSGTSAESGLDHDEWSRLVAASTPNFRKFGPGGSLVPLTFGNNADEPNWINQDLLASHYTGIVDLKAEEVVSENNQGRYAPFPGAMGLLQLAAEGKIERFGDGWKVLAKTNFPAWLSDYDSDFFVPKGVPVPSGDPGNACVFIEEKAMTMDGRNRC
jgi:hypothetical protein